MQLRGSTTARRLPAVASPPRLAGLARAAAWLARAPRCLLATTVLAACGDSMSPPPPPPPGGGTGADVVATLTSPPSAVSGESILLTVNIRNTGPAEATGLSARLDLREGLDVTSISNDGVYAGGAVEWSDLGTAASGDARMLTVELVAPAVGPLAASASAESEAPDPISTNNNGSSSNAKRSVLITFEPIRTLTGESAGDLFGWLIEVLGDTDGDGVDDFVVTAPSAQGGAGRAYVYSGATGTELHTFTGPGGGALGTGVDVAGDVDGDGVPDVLLGAPNTTNGAAYVYSGASGARLYELVGENGGDRFGQAVGRLGDVNGDGYDDFLVGAPGHDDDIQNSGRVYVYSGKDGSVIRTANSDVGNSQFGSALGGIGDVDGDGVPDFGVGAPMATGAGRIYVLSGATAEPVFPSIAADATGVILGQFWLNSPGDVNGDGAPDIFASDIQNAGAAPFAGRAYIFSGADGSVLVSVDGEAGGDGFGIGRGVSDRNGDGIGDLFLAAWLNDEGGQEAGKAYVISGADGTVLRDFASLQANENFGYDAVGTGDLDGDGVPDFLVSGGVAAGSPGHVHVIAGLP